MQPEGPIYSSLMNFIANENDMNALFDVDSLINSQCIQTLCQNVEEICQRISEFMVSVHSTYIFNLVISLKQINFSQKKALLELLLNLPC